MVTKSSHSSEEHKLNNHAIESLNYIRKTPYILPGMRKNVIQKVAFDLRIEWLNFSKRKRATGM